MLVRVWGTEGLVDCAERVAESSNPLYLHCTPDMMNFRKGPVCKTRALRKRDMINHRMRAAEDLRMGV